jgi:asparagine synthase (glutamine-hydrolysing)
LKYNNGVSKRLVKHALRDRVPSDLLRQRKRGFAIPVHRWFRGELRGHFRDSVLADDALLRTYFDTGVIDRIFTEHVAGREQYGHHLWALLMFEHWLRYVDDRGKMKLSLPSAY